MKKNLLKSMLVAVMTVMASSAWAQTSTLLEYGTADVAWTTDNLAEWTAGGNPTIKDGYVEITGGNGGYATSKTIEPTANAIINVQAVWRGRSNTGRDFSKGNGSYFRFGNIIVAQNDQDKKHGYGFTGLENMASVTTFTAGNYRVDIENCTWLLIEAEINTASNTLTSFTIKSEDGTTTYASAENVALSNADYTTVAFGYQKGSSVSTANAEDLKSVKITQTVQVVETADYTVKYVCDGVEVKEAVTRTGVVGQDIVLNAEDMQNFYTEDQKYIYVSNDVEGKTVGEGVVVTVTFRKAEKYAWTAKASMGDYTGYTISGETWEGDKASVKYPLYQLVDGTLWTKPATNKVFAQDFDVTEDNQELVLVYTETEITNVRFYAEVEDIEGMGIVDFGNAAARSSQRAAGYSISGATTITSLPKGKYQIFARFYSPTSAGGKYSFISGARTIWTEETDNDNATDRNTTVVLAKDNNEIKLDQTGATQAVDFIYIVYLGEPTEDEIKAANEADYNAELAAMKAQVNEYLPLIKKFFATFDKAAATALTTYFENLETALAGESIQDINDAMEALKSAATLYIAQDFTKIENYLNAMGNETLIADMTALKTAGLAYISGGDIQPVVSAAEKLAEDFKVAVPTYIEEVAAMAADGETEGKIGVNELKAAILAAQAAITPEADIVTVGEAVYNLIKAVKAYEAANDTTGITTIATATEQAPVYNMAGQRVMNAQKGLYIVNGKKVVKK